ncbi:alpha/beta hydrolase family protein [Brevundimonas variabilis]|uniref:Putative dienelactone hydrolase n=1 Tax=Brevundimonas variabilis TaxID=74312 RepID=A0A7W9CJI7_9CAUL|nr:dienelactone hydrolase [Brevundimonas variabilis]MBB5746850.1 putative dienelactone hydrolase [Brevundimonas variabilis]
MPLLNRATCHTLKALLAAAFLMTAASGATAEPLFRTFTLADPAGAPIEVGVWVPDDADPARSYPLVVMSHGNGGWFRSASDTAIALAEAGFVAAALTHTGDNWQDQSKATDMPDRVRQLGLLIDHMVVEGAGPVPVDADRIGAFGFSAGGFTVLAIAGAISDPLAIARHCQRDSRFFECGMIAQTSQADLVWGNWHRDTRVKAIVSAAPALGYSFTPESLEGLSIPVQLWRGSQDQVLPSPHYVEPVRDGLGGRADYRVAEGAGHFDFLPVCDEILARAAPQICTPTPGFDRGAFRSAFNAEVVAFFDRTLSPRAGRDPQPIP